MRENPPPVPEVLRECPRCGLEQVGYSPLDAANGADETTPWLEIGGVRYAGRFEDHSCAAVETFVTALLASLLPDVT